MFLRSFRSKAPRRQALCIKYLALIQSLESSGILTLQEEKAHSSWGQTPVKDTGDRTQHQEAYLLTGMSEELTFKAVHLKIQNLRELFMTYSG